MTTNIVDHAEQQYQTYTTQTSAITRSLAITAVAVVWLFGGGLIAKDATPEVLLARIQASEGLEAALLLALAALVLDLLQYAWGSLSWGTFHRRLDDVLEADDGHGSVGEGTDKAWARARKIGLVGQLERAAGLDPPADWGSRRDAVRAVVHPRDGAKRSPSVQRFLDRAAAPRGLTTVTAVLFAAKFLALCASYFFLAVFLL